MIVTFICSDRAEDRIRVQLRFRNIVDAINRTGLHLAHMLDLGSFVQHTPQAQKVCKRSDILVIYRYLYGPALEAIQYWKAQEKKVIVDLDQAIHCLTPDIPGYSFWVEGKPDSVADGCPPSSCRIDPVPLEQLRWGLGMVDAATVASPRLVRDWSHFTPVYEIPDYLNTYQYPVFEQDHPGEVWIGLAPGGRSAALRQSGLASALERLCRAHPEIRLALCGLEGQTALDLAIDPGQVVSCCCPTFDEWVYLLLKLDIGLAPMTNDFDLHLSPVALLEFMIAKIPWIASRRFSFHDLSRYGLGVQNSPQAWESALEKVMRRLDYYKKMAGGEPFLYALGQDAGAHIGKALRIYSTIFNQ